MSWHSIGVHVLHHCTDVSTPGSIGSMFFTTVRRDLDLTFQCVLFMTSYRGGNSWLKILGRISQTVITYQINSTYFSQGIASRRRRINLRFSWNKHRTFSRPLAARTLASIVSSQQPLRSPWVCHIYFDSSNYTSPPWQEHGPVRQLRSIVTNDVNHASPPHIQDDVDTMLHGVDEYRKHYGDGWHYVCIWRCVDGLPFAERNYTMKNHKKVNTMNGKNLA